MVDRPEQPRAMDVPASDEALVAGEDLGVLTHGMLVALGVSMPLWLGIVWLVTWLVATLPSL
jgi:hypothetical protein